MESTIELKKGIMGVTPQDAMAAVEPLIMRPVRMVVLYKPTGDCSMKDISLKDARAYIVACVQSMEKKLKQECVDTRKTHSIEDCTREVYEKDFFAFMVDWEDRTVTPTRLGEDE